MYVCVSLIVFDNLTQSNLRWILEKYFKQCFDNIIHLDCMENIFIKYI